MGEAPQDGQGAPVFARNQAELGATLGCDRRTIARYMKQDGNPGRTPDGRYNITEWKLWTVQNAHIRPKPGSDKASLEAEALKLRNAKLEIDLAIAKGDLNSLDETTSVLTGVFTAMVSRFTSLKHELAPSLVGETVAEATKRLGAAFTEAFRDLSLADWAKKKTFWRSVSDHLSSLQARFCPSSGPFATSASTQASDSIPT